MTDLENALVDWGCDTEETLRRMLGDADLYVSLLERFAEDLAEAGISRLLSEGRTKEAFVLAHRRKGSAVELGIRPMEEALTPLVERLRHGEPWERELDRADHARRSFLSIMDRYEHKM